MNTAIALGRLGVPSALLSGISTDLFGKMLIEALAASRVDTGFTIRSGQPTTLAFVRIHDGQASYAFHDENTAGRMILPPGEIQAGIMVALIGGPFFVHIARRATRK